MILNEIQQFENWLSEKTRNIDDIKRRKIHIGGLQLSLEYLADQWGNTNPLNINVNDPLSSIKNFTFHPGTDDKKESAVQFIKRIKNTPFYDSYSVSKTCSLKMIDFYQWNPVPSLYRIFILQKYKIDSDIQINCPAAVKISSSNENIIMDKLYLKISQAFELSKDKKSITIQTKKEINQQVIVMAISTEAINHEISFHSAVKLLHQLEEICRENHINKSFIVNYKSAEQELDDLWTVQKYIHPDHTIDQIILNDPGKYDKEITWIVELYCYLGWQESLFKILNAIKISIIKENINWRSVYTACYLENYLNIESKDRFTNQYLNENKDKKRNIFHELCLPCSEKMVDINKDDIIYSAYFRQSIKSSILIEYIQEWWNITSLPLLNRRLLKELAENQEKILLVTLLGLMHQLPWISLLMQYMKNEDFDPLFRMIAFMFSRLTVRKSMENKEFIYSGFKWDNNVKRLFRTDNGFSYAYTRFSKNVYFTVKEKNTILFKIDHQVHCIYDNQSYQFTVLPVAFNMDRSVYQELQIKVDNFTLNLPLVFKKGEIFFCDVRFRWIFKKKRFQFTLLNKDKDKKVIIDNQPVSFIKSIKQKYYVTINPKNAEVETLVLNQYGRSIHFTNPANLREIQIYGWACDRFGILAQHFNYTYARKQYINTIDPSGAINNKVFIPSGIKEINFIIKRARKQLPVQFYNSSFIEKIIKFSPRKRNDNFLVLIDQELIKKISDIQKFFSDTFAFQPEYRIKTADMIPIQCSNLLYISTATNKIEIIKEPSISSQPFCRIGIEKGIGHLSDFYQFLKEHLTS